jgi:hypothetical protein
MRSPQRSADSAATISAVARPDLHGYQARTRGVADRGGCRARSTHHRATRCRVACGRLVQPRLRRCGADLDRLPGVIDQRHSANGGIWGFERFHLVDVEYGDLTNDGKEDALLVVESTTEAVGHKVPSPQPVFVSVWLMQLRGDDLVMYTTESAETPPTSISIAFGVANVVWREHGTICQQRWRFGPVGEGALKSDRTCHPDRARR